MSDGGILVRRMEDANWPAFHEIFREVVAGGDTIAYPDDLTSEGARVRCVEQSSVAVVAVDEDGTVLGGAKCGPRREGRGRHVATASFMVGSAARGRGVGRALGDWVLDWARSPGFAAMQFDSVVETNTAAVARWQHLGFTVLCTVPEAFDSRTHGRVGMHVMHRYL
jgi:L-amino acid N-acyltransferase YncA